MNAIEKAFEHIHHNLERTPKVVIREAINIAIKEAEENKARKIFDDFDKLFDGTIKPSYAKPEYYNQLKKKHLKKCQKTKI